MNSLNAKRIGVLAASLLFGLAVAGSVSFNNIPIINGAGQPVAQVVVGSQAQISDGIVAANIAAVIGNLAFTSTPVMATVSGTSGVTCTVTTPSCAISNQQVYLEESGTIAVPTGSYGISALIGSVLNQGVILGSPSATKTTLSSSNYVFPRGSGIDQSPADSPYTVPSWVPTSTTANGASNGGGFSAYSFTNGSNDNLLQMTNAQLPSLLSNSGSNGESEYLWLTGFPVYDQQTSPSAQNFTILSAGGAYQAVFNKPIHEPANLSKSANNAQFQLLGQNWTIVSYKLPGGTVSSSTNTVAGGEIGLASSLVPMKTVFVGENLTSGSFKVELTDLGQAANNGQSPASVSVYYNNVLTNVTAIYENTTQVFNVSGQTVDVHVGQTFAGLYAYEKWAKMQLYSGIYNITSGQVFNQSKDPGWRSELLWTNSSGNGTPTDLQSIILYNTTPKNLLPGQSFNFIQNPAEYKVTFVGDTLGNNFDSVTFQPEFDSSIEYANTGAITNVTEPAQELVVTSSIPNAFSYGGQTSSTLTYLLGTYGLTLGNAVSGAPATISVSMETGYSSSELSNQNLQLLVTGYVSNASTQTITYPYTISGTESGASLEGNLSRVTSMQLTSGYLPGMVLSVMAGNALIGTLTYNPSPVLTYSQSGKNYVGLTSGASVTYNQQNGQPATDFTMNSIATPTSFPPFGHQLEFYNYSIGEYNVGGSTSSQDGISFAITNSTATDSLSAPYSLNSTTRNKLNATYTSSSGITFPVQTGFRTERGSEVESISPSEMTLNLAKTVDTLKLVVGAAGSNSTISTSGATLGPYAIGQQTNLAGTSIANMTATCSFTASTSCSVGGIANITASPSLSTASTPIGLNTATAPLVVVDSQANPYSIQIVVGSKYVNSVAAQIFAQNPTLDSSFGPSSVIEQAEGSNRILVAGYYANQTVQAGNQFIEALLSAAST